MSHFSSFSAQPSGDSKWNRAITNRTFPSPGWCTNRKWPLDGQRHHIAIEARLCHEFAKQSNIGTSLGVSVEVQRASGGYQNGAHTIRATVGEIPRYFAFGSRVRRLQGDPRNLRYASATWSAAARCQISHQEQEGRHQNSQRQKGSLSIDGATDAIARRTLCYAHAIIFTLRFHNIFIAWGTTHQFHVGSGGGRLEPIVWLCLHEN